MNDVLISHEISNSKNNRFIIFNGMNEQDGKVYVLANNDVNESLDNYVYLKSYLKKYYSNDLAIKSIVDDPYNFDKKRLLFLMLEQYNMAIFEDVTNDFDLSEGNIRQIGIFYLPSYVTEKQKEKILNFRNYFRNYKQITFSSVVDDDDYNLDSFVDDFISGDDIDRLDEFLHLPIKYKKNN